MIYLCTPLLNIIFLVSQIFLLFLFIEVKYLMNEKNNGNKAISYFLSFLFSRIWIPESMNEKYKFAKFYCFYEMKGGSLSHKQKCHKEFIAAIAVGGTPDFQCLAQLLISFLQKSKCQYYQKSEKTLNLKFSTNTAPMSFYSDLLPLV